MDFKQIVKAHLDKMAQQDFAFAERYKLESKNLDSCIAYIKSQAKKQAKNGCAAIEDAVVYGWAVHYYQEDSVIITETKAKVVTPKPVEKTLYTEKAKVEEIKPIKALVKDRKNEGKCVQLDLFGDF